MRLVGSRPALARASRHVAAVHIRRAGHAPAAALPRRAGRGRVHRLPGLPHLPLPGAQARLGFGACARMPCLASGCMPEAHRELGPPRPLSACHAPHPSLLTRQNAYDPVNEGEGHDRATLALNPNQARAATQACMPAGSQRPPASLFTPAPASARPLQARLVRELAAGASRPIIVVLIHGGPIDVSALMSNARVGAVLTAWYPAQGVMAIPDVLLGTTPPSGARLAAVAECGAAGQCGRRLVCACSARAHAFR